MDFTMVTAAEMRAARIVTGATMAAWILAGFMPRHAHRLRTVLLALYLTGAAVFALYVLLR